MHVFFWRSLGPTLSEIYGVAFLLLCITQQGKQISLCAAAFNFKEKTDFKHCIFLYTSCKYYPIIFSTAFILQPKAPTLVSMKRQLDFVHKKVICLKRVNFHSIDNLGAITPDIPNIFLQTFFRE